MRYLATLPKALAIMPIFFMAISCAPNGTNSDPPAVSRSSAASYDSSNSASSASGDNIEQIRNQRSQDSFTPDFAIGPGDVISISVPDVPEINSRSRTSLSARTISIYQ